ncbi:MAG TPA: hypothetical protein VFW89_02970 [Gemmatimonadaceae bacterium]|nr:hypothetical protein [Gemmatimonadaceae bacterium]
MRVTVHWLGLVALAAIAACSGDDPTDPGALCDVTNPVMQVSVSPATDTVRIRIPARPADAVQLTAVVTGRTGNPRTDVPVAFTSSDTAIATVSSTGLVQLRAPGHAVIRAKACDQSASATIVAVAAVASVVVAPTPDTLVSGDTLLFTASAIGSTGAPLTDAVFDWTSSNAALGVITSSGPATAMLVTSGAGSTTVTASAEGSSGSASVVVLPRVFLADAASGAPAIDAGLDYSCALITRGRAYCWGVDDEGQLGASADSTCFGDTRSQLDTTGTTHVTNKPCALAPQRFAPDLAFATVSAGDSAACGISDDGRAWCWGKNDFGQLGNGLLGTGAPPKLVTSALTFTRITAGGAHACAIASDGSAWCWGSDVSGQLGDGRFVNSTTPIPVVPDQISGTPTRFASLSAGFAHTCGITVSGTAWCWGSNEFAQLGAATTEQCPSTGTPCGSAPLRVALPAGVTLVTISAGVDHSCALDTDGHAWCWGANGSGQLGNGTSGASLTSTPVQVTGGHTFTRISAGSRFTCAIDAGGAAWCWGLNSDLQLGIGPYSGGDDIATTPRAVLGNLRFASVSTGQRHSCGVTTDGKAYCWGSDVFGALGNTLQAAFRGIPQVVAGAQ